MATPNPPTPIPATRLAPVPTGHEPAVVGAPEVAAGLGLLDYWRIVREYRWSVLGLVIIAGIIGGLTALSATPVYRAEVRLLVQYNQRNLSTVNRLDGGPSYWLFYETQRDIIRSRAIAERAADKLKTAQRSRPADAAEVSPRWRTLLASLLPDWRDWLPAEWRRPEPPPVAPAAAERLALVGEIRSGLSVRGGEESQLIEVSYDSPDPRMAAQVANGVADAYVEFGLEAQLSFTRKASSWLGERLEELRQKVDRSEQALRAYQQRSGMVDTQSRETMIGARLGSLSTELIKAQARRSEAEARHRQVQKASKSANPYQALGALLDSPLLREAYRDAVESGRRVTEFSERYGEKHPKMIAARADDAQASRRLEREVDKAVGSVRKEFEVARTQEAELRRIIARQEAEMRGLSGKAFALAKLEREVKANRDLYATFMERQKEMDVASDYDVTNVRIVDSARIPVVPVKPNKRRMVVIALFVGLVIGVLLSVLRDYLDNTFKTRDEIERTLKLSVLGIVPRVRAGRWRRTRIGRHVLDDPQSAFAEAINDVRTAILLSDVDRPAKVIMVTSAAAGEGKTTLASNLAIAFSHRGRTLLLDADLRRGRLHQNVTEIRKGRGLTDVVTGECALQDAVTDDGGADDLFMMAVGTLPPNPLEILSSRRFATALENLRGAFEFIVIDASPILPVSDSIVLGRLVDGLVLTVQSDKTTHNMARDALKRLQGARLTPIGVVLQQVDLRKMRRYAGGYPDYDSTYYGYHSPDRTAGG